MSIELVGLFITQIVLAIGQVLTYIQSRRKIQVEAIETRAAASVDEASAIGSLTKSYNELFSQVLDKNAHIITLSASLEELKTRVASLEKMYEKEAAARKEYEDLTQQMQFRLDEEIKRRLDAQEERDDLKALVKDLREELAMLRDNQVPKG